VDEFPVLGLLEEAVGGGRVGPAVLDQVDVEQAVVVEIEEGGAGAHDLWKEVRAGRPGVMSEIEADFLGHVLEPFGPGRLVNEWPRIVAAKKPEAAQRHGDDEDYGAKQHPR